MGYGAWEDNGTAYFRFDDLAAVKGPFRFYIQDPQVVIEPESIYQRYIHGNKIVEISWPLQLIGGASEFSFRAVTLYIGGDPPDIQEAPLTEGVMPFPNKDLGVK